MIAPVSVVIPCFRCADTIDRALASVAAQTLAPAEVLLVDDGNDDATPAALAAAATRYSSPQRIRILRLARNAGAATARNHGWDAATATRYVAFLDADDSWHPRKLELQLAAMAGAPAVAVCGHLHAVTDDLVARVITTDPPALTPVDFTALLWRNRFVTSSVVLRRDLPQRFASGQRHMEDHRLWLEIAHAGFALARLEVVLAAHHKPDFGAGGLSAQLWRMERAELVNYAELRRAGAIGRVRHAQLAAWSLAKFARRLAIVGARALRGERRGDRSR